jgi:hypothetical protein
LEAAMIDLGICLMVQLCLVIGVGGLFWPERFMPLFEVLLVPWAASYRALRANSPCRHWVIVAFAGAPDCGLQLRTGERGFENLNP